MLIKPYTGTANPDHVFIKADTCFFNLTVPDYSSAGMDRVGFGFGFGFGF
jgi:hypothetical protein